jgi:hypothetical protein
VGFVGFPPTALGMEGKAGVVGVAAGSVTVVAPPAGERPQAARRAGLEDAGTS